MSESISFGVQFPAGTYGATNEWIQGTIVSGQIMPEKAIISIIELTFNNIDVLAEKKALYLQLKQGNSSTAGWAAGHNIAGSGSNVSITYYQPANDIVIHPITSFPSRISIYKNSDASTGNTFQLIDSGGGVSYATLTLTYDIPPEKPTNLYFNENGAANYTGSNFTLKWDSVEKATSYKVYRNYDFVSTIAANSYSSTLSGSYRIRASNSVGDSDYSDAAVFTYAAAPQNTAPKLGSVTCSPSKIVSGVSTRVTFTFSVTDNGIVGGNTASITRYEVYSNSGLTTLEASGTNNPFTTSISATGTYYCIVRNRYDKSNVVTVTVGAEAPIVVEIPTIKINSKYEIGADTVVKEIQSITGKVTRNNTVVSITNCNWALEYGATKTSLTESVIIPGNTLTLSNGINPYSLTIKQTNSILTNPYYRIRFTATVGAETKNAYTSVYAYPAELTKPDSNEIGYNFSESGTFKTKESTYSTDLNDKINLKFILPTTGTNRKPSLSSATLRVSYSKNTTFSLNFTPNYSQNLTGFVSGTNSYSLDLDTLTVPRGYYVKFRLVVQDVMGQSYSADVQDEIGGETIFHRIDPPTFGNNGRINLSYGQAISVNQLEDSAVVLFALPSFNTYLGTLEPALTKRDIYYNYLKKLTFEINNTTLTQKTYQIALNAADTTFEYDEGLSTGYFQPTGKALKTLFSSLSNKNEAFQTYLILTLIDVFGNETTITSKIILKSSTQVDFIYLSFGTPPKLEDYSHSSYQMYLKYRYSSASFTEVVENETMINPGDRLKFYFPKAIDANGVNDIKKYRIKIVRKDSKVQGLDIANDFVELKTFALDALSNETNGYSCEIEASNYQVSKFIRIGVCAVDSTELESNLIIYPITLIGGRVAQGSMTLESSSIENYNGGDSAGLTYTLRVKIADLGGNLFNDKTFTYENYPNFERTMGDLVTLTDCRDIFFDLFYSKDGVAWGNVSGLSYRIDNIPYTTYPTTLSYSSLLTKTIKFEPINLIGDEDDETGNFISLIKKNYFYLRAKIQNGFDESGNKTYSYIQTETFVLYPSTPVVAYRQNYLGINTKDFGFYEPYNGTTYDVQEHYYIKTSAGGFVEVNPSGLVQKDQYYIKSRNHAVVIAEINNRKNIYFVSGEDRICKINIATGEIDNFIIDGGDWDSQYISGYLKESSEKVVIDSNSKYIEPIGGEYTSEFAGDRINTFITDVIGDN